MADANYDSIDENMGPNRSPPINSNDREFQIVEPSTSGRIQTSADALLGPSSTDSRTKNSDHEEIVALDSLNVETTEPVTECGIGPYRPECLQKFATRKWMLFWMCWFCFVQVICVQH